MHNAELCHVDRVVGGVDRCHSGASSLRETWECGWGTPPAMAPACSLPCSPVPLRARMQACSAEIPAWAAFTFQVPLILEHLGLAGKRHGPVLVCSGLFKIAVTAVHAHMLYYLLTNLLFTSLYRYFWVQVRPCEGIHGFSSARSGQAHI